MLVIISFVFRSIAHAHMSQKLTEPSAQIKLTCEAITLDFILKLNFKTDEN
jgi:hypothetical protein